MKKYSIALMAFLVFSIFQINSSHAQNNRVVSNSYITSKFSGFSHGNLYKFANGEIWEQTEYWIWTWTWIWPKAVVYFKNGALRMKVEGIDHPVAVRKLR